MAANYESRNDTKRSFGLTASMDQQKGSINNQTINVMSHSAALPSGQLTALKQTNTSVDHLGPYSQRGGYMARRSNKTNTSRAYQSLGMSKFDTMSSNTVRPSTSFTAVTRKTAIDRHK